MVEEPAADNKSHSRRSVVTLGIILVIHCALKKKKNVSPRNLAAEWIMYEAKTVTFRDNELDRKCFWVFLLLLAIKMSGDAAMQVCLQPVVKTIIFHCRYWTIGLRWRNDKLYQTAIVGFFLNAFQCYSDFTLFKRFIIQKTLLI